MTQSEFERLLEKYLKGETDAAENKLIDKWFASIQADSKLPEKEAFLIKNRIKHQLDAHKLASQTPTVTLPKVVSYRFALRLAASFAVLALIVTLFVVNPFFSSDSQVAWNAVENLDDKDLIVKLDDGTVVTIKKGGEFKYPDTFRGETRDVILSKGSAFFDVKRDVEHPFIVRSNNVTTKVLGTSFLVNSDNIGAVVVSVKTGKVLVSAIDKNQQETSVLLTANQEVTFEPESTLAKSSIVSKPVPIVTKKELESFVFSNASTSDVLHAMEKVYGISIDFNEDKLANCFVTTYLEQNEDLFERLNIICKAIGATYTVDGLTINVSSDGCK